MPTLFLESAAVHVTEVEPNGNVVPDAGVQTGVRGPSTMSMAVAENVTTAPLCSVFPMVMFAGTLTIGGVVSRTVTVKLAVAELPAASAAVHVTVVVPIGKVVPDAGAQVTGTAPSTLPVAVGSV